MHFKSLKMQIEKGAPLVRERSVVQSHAAAPAKCLCGIDYRDCRRPYCPPLHDATEREHAPSRRAESVRDVLEAFEAWLDQQVLPLEIAEHANRILRYLRMAEEKPLPACLRAALAEHVAAVSTGRL
jgi:hypothetical protein